MPIRIPNELPAARTLKSENIFVMTEQRAMGQDIRPLRILLLNLMPTKIASETQLSRLEQYTPSGGAGTQRPPGPRAQEHPPGAYAGLLPPL